jgi:hypothetical protein
VARTEAEDVADLLKAATDVLRAPEHVDGLPDLARALGVYPVEAIRFLAAHQDFPKRGPEGWNVRAAREWLAAHGL